MRYLAIDLGDKRTGLALGDDVIGLITPLPIIEETDRARLLTAIAGVIDEQGPEALVVGLAINMDGTEGERATLTREFAGQLEPLTRLPVHLQDERLTSFDAEGQLSQSGLTHGEKKARRDSLAAATILRDFLAEQSRRNPNES
jgi:putative pre-16S rRNA nuclease